MATTTLTTTTPSTTANVPFALYNHSSLDGDPNLSPRISLSHPQPHYTQQTPQQLQDRSFSRSTVASTLQPKSPQLRNLDIMPDHTFECDMCDETFHFGRFLNLHVRQIHHRLPVHHCPHCRNAYGTAKDLNSHIIARHAARRAFACHECTCSFQSSLLLRYHVSDAHSAIVRHCHDCNFRTMHDAVLMRHLRQRHNTLLVAAADADVAAEAQNVSSSYHAAEQRTIGYISAQHV